MSYGYIIIQNHTTGPDNALPCAVGWYVCIGLFWIGLNYFGEGYITCAGCEVFWFGMKGIELDLNRLLLWAELEWNARQALVKMGLVGLISFLGWNGFGLECI